MGFGAHVGALENIAILGFEHRTVQLVENLCSDCAIPAPFWIL